MVTTAEPTLNVKSQSEIENLPQMSRYVLQGTLRKKGLVFKNERIVKLDSLGVLSYYNRDSPDIAK